MLKRIIASFEKLEAPPKLLPLSQREFLKLLSLQFALQGAVVIPWLFALNSARSHHRIDLALYLCLAIVIPTVIMEKWFSRIDLPRRRLMALYPDQPLPNGLYSQLVRGFPLIGLPVYCYLALKNEPSSGSMPWLLARSAHLFFVAIGLPTAFAIFIALTSIAQRASYWILDPHLSYVVETIGELNMGLTEHRRVSTTKLNDGYRPSNDAKAGLVSYPGSMILLVTATEQASTIPKSERQRRIQVAVDGALNVLELSEQIVPVESRFNPIFYVSPTATAATALLTALEQAAAVVFNRKLVNYLESTIAEIKSPDLVEQYRRRLAQSRNFKDAKVVGETMLGQYLASKGKDSLASSK